jgi:ABC-2 type transport system permease protein
MKWRQTDMTQTASITSFFGISLKEKLKNKRFWTILIITNLLSGPLFVLNSYYIESRSSLWISILASIVVGALAFVIPLNFFDYLYQKTKIDDVLKLPLTRRELFFSDYLSGLILYIIPMFGQFLISMILIRLRATKFINYFIKNTATIDDSFYRVLRLAFFAYLFIIIGLIFLYTLTVLVLSCVGNTFEAITASLYVNLLIPGVIYSVGYLLLNHSFGISFQVLFQKLINFTSPGGLLLYLAENYNRTFHDETWNRSLYSATGLWTLFLAFLMTLVILWLSYRNFVRRKAECVGTGFVNRIFYYFVMTSLTFLLAAFFYHLDFNFITSLSLLAFIFLTFEVITNRGFQKFYRSIVRFAIISAIAGCSILVINKTEVFGIVFRATDIANMNSITIRYHGVLDTYTNDYSVTLKNPENIKAVLTFHQRVLDDYKESKITATETTEALPNQYYDSYLPTYNIEITFHVKNGLDYTRTYDVNFNQKMLLASIDLSDEYIDQLLEHYSKQNTIIINDVFDYSSIRYPMKDEKIKELYQCLAKDMKKLTLEEYLTPSTPTRFKIGEIPVLESYTETLAFFENNYVNMSTFNLENIFNRTIIESNFGIIAPIKTLNKNQLYYYGYPSYFHAESPRYANSEQIEKLKEDITNLLEHAQYQYITTTPCYRIIIGKWSYVIPPEYSDLAAELYNKLQ